MIEIVPYEPRRFRTAAAHYHARPPYSPRIFPWVVAFCGLSSRDRVMDLGCGPGPLTTGFAPLVHEVIAVDPEPDMLGALIANAAAFGKKVTAVQGSSNDLGPHFGTFKAVVMGRSFHWMDRVETLKRLDQLIEPGGAVVLLDVKPIPTEESRWMTDYRQIIERYADDGGAVQRQPTWTPHEAMIIGSPFRDLKRIAVVDRVVTAADSLVDRALSMSRTSPGEIGPEKMEAMVSDIRALIDKVAVDGNVTEILETTALIARRPA